MLVQRKEWLVRYKKIIFDVWLGEILSKNLVQQLSDRYSVIFSLHLIA